MKRKLLTWVLIFLVLFNFIFGNDAYATGSEDTVPDSKAQNELKGDQMELNNEWVTDTTEGGYSTDKEGNQTPNTAESRGVSIMGTILGILAGLLNVIVFQLDIIMGQLTCCTETNGATSANDFQYFFTIERTVFNRIPLFNINFFNFDTTYKVGNSLEIQSSASINTIKERVAQMFYVVRLVATGASLLVLVYIGIRMAISTLSEDKAKYKKMLIGWVESIVILFLLEYIMAAVITFGEVFINIFYELEVSVLNGAKSFEVELRDNLFLLLFDSSGVSYAMNTVMYWFMLFMQVKYFWTYLKRVLMVGFLVMIAPLITITYGMDKAGDGKAQAFSIWLKEFVVNVLIQPLHALIYLVFVLSAGEIAKLSPIIAIAFIMCMGAVERMVKVIFDLNGLVSLRGLDKFGKKK